MQKVIKLCEPLRGNEAAKNGNVAKNIILIA